MPPKRTVRIGVSILRNRLSPYLKLASAGSEVIITERGKPIAGIQPIMKAAKNSVEARIAALAATDEIVVPERPLRLRIRLAKVRGALLSERIVADRR